MKLSLFGENKKVLLVGEGNFSFAVTLAKHNLNIHLTASCFENNAQETGKKNIDILKNHGIRVLLSVDATKLEEHKILNLEKFDIVVFNFPHVGGKMRIEKNRELLRKFFISVKSILHRDSQVFMSLCDGQGGTPADKKLRKWNDSWQVTEMAAHGNFLLVEIEPYNSSIFETYTVTGYRSLEKQFNTQDSLVHVFKATDEPSRSNIAPKQKIDLKSNYSETIDWKDVTFETSTMNSSNNRHSNLSLYSNHYKFDMTLSTTPAFDIVEFYETLYNTAGLIIDKVEFLGSYSFPDSKETKTFRITYKSKIFPLYRKLVLDLHEKVIPDIIKQTLNISVSR